MEHDLNTEQNKELRGTETNTGNTCDSSSQQPIVVGKAYLVAVKSGQEIEQRIIVAKDVFDVERKVKQSFKRIDWWEIRCNYGVAVL
jgi:hypothetical protein